jgi:uncharacterized protein YutE (UPF0331/DUF86 family)
MADVKMILERLKRLAEYVEFLNRKKSLRREEFLQSQESQLAVERALQLAIQIVIDIATHILSTTSNETPKDYSEAIIKLARIGVIPTAFANKIAPMPRFRNVLVHEYVDIDMNRVYRNLQDELDDFAEFARYINEWLSRNNLLDLSNPKS